MLRYQDAQRDMPKKGLLDTLTRRRGFVVSSRIQNRVQHLPLQQVILGMLLHGVLHQQLHLLAGGISGGRRRQCQHTAPEDVMPTSTTTDEPQHRHVQTCQLGMHRLGHSGKATTGGGSTHPTMPMTGPGAPLISPPMPISLFHSTISGSM